MSLSIKRGSNAPDLSGITPGTSYPVFALTDTSAVILTDDEKLLTIAYRHINAGEEWSVVSEKLKRDELPHEDKKSKK